MQILLLTLLLPPPARIATECAGPLSIAGHTVRTLVEGRADGGIVAAPVHAPSRAPLLLPLLLSHNLPLPRLH
jgi:hypothetical protein